MLVKALVDRSCKFWLTRTAVAMEDELSSSPGTAISTRWARCHSEAVRAAHDDAFAVAQRTHEQQPVQSFVHCSKRLHQFGIHDELHVAVFGRPTRTSSGSHASSA
jgi:hypothetical protein